MSEVEEVVTEGPVLDVDHTLLVERTVRGSEHVVRSLRRSHDREGRNQPSRSEPHHRDWS